MYTIGAAGLRWLKGFHLVAVSCWVGGGTALVLMYFLKIDINDGGVLYGVNRSIHHVDIAVVVIPGAFGCLLTGLLYSAFSRWGFFKHKWLVYKWIVTVSAIFFGTFYLGPWETKMMEISGQLGLGAIADDAYLYNQKMNIIYGTAQVMLLIVTVFISILKPWGSRSKK